MRTLYLMVSLLLAGTGLLHMAATFRYHRQFSAGALWFFGAGLLLVLIGALNLFCRRHAAALPALRSFTFWCNALMCAYTFCSGLATKASVPQMLVLVGAALLASVLSRLPSASAR